MPAVKHSANNAATSSVIAAPHPSTSIPPAERSPRRLSDRSVALAGLGRLALRTADLQLLFQETVRLLALSLRAEFAEVLQHQPEEDRFLMVAGVGWSRSSVGRASLRRGNGSHAGFALLSRSAVVVRDLAKERRFRPPALWIRQKIVSGICVPIGSELEPWGALGVHTRQRRKFSGRDVHFLQAVSHILSEAIHRHRAEAELKDREYRLRLLTDSMPALIAYCDQNQIYQYCNARYTEWFGLKTEEVVGKKVIDVLGSAAYARVEPAIRRALAGEHVTLEAHLPYLHGPPRDVHVDYIPHLNAKQRVLGYYVMIVDFSDRVRAEATRGWLAAIVEHSHDAIVGKDLNGIITTWNAAAERMYGYRPEEIIGKPVEMLFPPDRKEEMRSILKRVAQGEAVEQVETVRLCKDGTPLDVLVTISPIRGERNQILGASSISHDMSSFKQANRALRESEERLRLAKEAAELGIFDWSIATDEVRWDARVRELWGVSDDEPITYDIFCAGIEPEDREPTRAAVKRALDPSGDGKYSAEFRVTQQASGTTYWIAATGQVTFEEGLPVRMVGTVQDISERKQVQVQTQEWADRLAEQLALTQKVEESLRRSNLNLEEFTGVVTHDLRTPLASALFTGELLREVFQSGDLEQTNTLLELVLRSLWQMDELVKELHSQALVRSPEIDQQEVSLDQIVNAAEQRAALLLEKTGGHVERTGPLPTVRGNPAMLAQLFSNLIENAIKYRRGEPPLVRIGSTSDQRHHLVMVSDNGRGVPEADRERVFMPRERGSNVGDIPGSGLGLALCRRIMQAHGGTISIGNSEAGGAAFELLFPRVPGTASRRKTKPATKELHPEESA